MKTPPLKIGELITRNLAEQLSLGHDVLHVDVDAFLLQDPMKLFDQFPQADIISSVETVYCNRRECWYWDDVFQRKHGGQDPFGAQGFMLNMGMMFVRSNPKTIRIAKAAEESVKAHTVSHDQIAWNEELL